MARGTYEALETAASRANSEDHSSITALINEVFNVPHYSIYLPVELRNPLKSRFIEAEMSHRRGVRAGIPEEAIARAINEIADRFGLPEYAKTNSSQVRYLRMRLVLASPALMHAGMVRQDATVGEQINSTMSPAQALHLILVLADQKYSNPTYQVSPHDWDARGGPPAFEAQPASQHSGSRLTVVTNSRQGEIRNAISKAAGGLSTADAQGLIEQVLRTLGL